MVKWGDEFVVEVELVFFCYLVYVSSIDVEVEVGCVESYLVGVCKIFL